MQAVSKILSLLMTTSVVFGSISCKTLGNSDDVSEPTQEAQPASMKIPIGTVHVVRRDENFVLVKSTRFLQVEPETDLFVFDSGGVETARLRVSPARKGQFVTADIVSGMPKAGDQVLMDYRGERSATPASANTSAADDEIQVLE